MTEKMESLKKDRDETAKLINTYLSQKYKVEEISKLLEIPLFELLDLFKECNIYPLTTDFFREGCNTEKKRDEVEFYSITNRSHSHKSTFLKGLDNGMLYRFDWESPDYVKSSNLMEYFTKYQPLRCWYCGSNEESGRCFTIKTLNRKENDWSLTNLIPVCTVCNSVFHSSCYQGPIVTISKQFTFENSHRLLNYQGPCERIHGHSYFLQVYVEGPVNPRTGMLIDYKILKEAVSNTIISLFDHSFSNDFMKCNPTAENMLFFIWERLEKYECLKGLSKILLKETSTSEAVLTAQNMRDYQQKNECYIFDGGGVVI